MKRFMMILMVFCLLFGCQSKPAQNAYYDEERKIQELSGREAFIWVPQSWKVVKENDRLYFLDGDHVIMTQTALHPYESVSEEVENTPYVKDIQVKELIEIHEVENGMKYGKYLVEQGGKESENFFIHLGKGAESDFVFIVWDQEIGEDLIKEIAISLEAH